MNDPEVAELYYKFVSDNPNDLFDSAKPIDFSKQGFDFHLENGVLTVRPQNKYPNADIAKNELEPLLRAWELSAFISSSHHRIRFVFEDANIIDLNPDPNTHDATISLGSAYMVAVAENVTLSVNNSSYPDLENNYTASALTDELVTRLKQMQDQREHPTTVAYYILDKLGKVIAKKTKNRKNKRKGLAKELKIDWDVLDILGDIANKTDPLMGRHADIDVRPLNPEEKSWLEQVSFRLVARIAEYDKDPENLKPITLKDFPILPD